MGQSSRCGGEKTYLYGCSVSSEYELMLFKDIITLAIYIVANLGLALVNVYWAVMLLRIFQVSKHAPASASAICLNRQSALRRQ